MPSSAVASTAPCRPSGSYPSSTSATTTCRPPAKTDDGLVVDYEGKIAVVTGGAGGIGRGLVHALLTRGAHVVVADVEAPALAAAVDQLASVGTVRGVRTDVSDADSVAALA